MDKRYRRRAQAVQALKTYTGQPMTDIRDFLLGSGVYLSTNEHGSTFYEPITGTLEVTPGDYVLRYDDGHVTSIPAHEFENEYEMDEWPQIESGLAYALQRIYGFSVESAFEAVADKTIRSFLVASLEYAALGHQKAMEEKTVDVLLTKPLDRVFFDIKI